MQQWSGLKFANCPGGPGDCCGEGEVQQCRSWDDNETSASPGFCEDPADFYFCGDFFFAGRGDREKNRRACSMLEVWSCLSTCCRDQK